MLFGEHVRDEMEHLVLQENFYTKAGHTEGMPEKMAIFGEKLTSWYSKMYHQQTL